MLEEGRITDLDIKIMRELLNLENKYPQIKEATYVKSVETEKLIVTLVGGGRVPAYIWKKAAYDLAKKLGKSVKIIERTPSIRSFVEQIIYPARVSEVSTLWLHDIRESHVKIRRSEARKSPVPLDVVSKLVKELINENLKFQIVEDRFFRPKSRRGRPKSQISRGS